MRAVAMQNQLKYKFDHVVLLYEALTHSFDATYRYFGTYNVWYKNKTSANLIIVGDSVLKLLATEYAIFTSSVNTESELILEHLVLDILRDEKLESIAEYKIILDKCILISMDTMFKSDFSFKKLYPDAVRAIFGAVYVDAQLRNGKGLEEAIKLFSRLWNVRLPNQKDLNKVLNPDNTEKSFIKELYDLEFGIGYKFKNKRLLEYSMNYSPFGNGNERLSAVGNAASTLAINEHFFWYWIGYNASLKQERYIANFKELVRKCLSLDKFVRKPDFMDVGDIENSFDSIIGAIYVDSKYSISTVNKVVRRLSMEYKVETKTADCFHSYQVKQYASSYRHLFCTRWDLMTIQTSGEGSLPDVQNTFKIRDVDLFMADWESFCLSPAEHRQRFEDALRFEDGEQSLESMRESGLPQPHYFYEVECNKMEYQRVSLYKVAARTKKYFSELNPRSPRNIYPVTNFSYGKLASNSDWLSISRLTETIDSVVIDKELDEFRRICSSYINTGIFYWKAFLLMIRMMVTGINSDPEKKSVCLMVFICLFVLYLQIKMHN